MDSQPSELELLTSFLLPPAPLPNAISLTDFKALFPTSARSSKDIPTLYRELQHQVSLGIDEVKQNLAAESRHGEETRAKVRRVRRRMDRIGADELADVETREMDIAMNGPTDEIILSNIHTERTITVEMELAITDLEQEISEMEVESTKILQDLQTTIGDLSDLRYGKFNKTPGSDQEFGQETLQNIQRIIEVCNQSVTKG